MNKNLIIRALVISLFTFGTFALINHNIAPADWSNPSKLGWVLLTIYMFQITSTRPEDQ